MQRIMDFIDLTDDEQFIERIDLGLGQRRPRVFRERPNYFALYDEREFKQRYRLSKDVVRFLINEIGEEISAGTNRNHALSSSEMILITLYFLATASPLKLIGDIAGINESTASRVVTKVVNAIASIIAPRTITMPATVDEMNKVKQDFYDIGRFPRCLGAIGTTQIKISSPGGIKAEIFRNREGSFSYNIQVVCDATLKIRDIVAHCPGSTLKSTIFSDCHLKYRFEQGEFGDGLLIGDEGYTSSIKPYLITPLVAPKNPAENLFNASLKKTHKTIERCIEDLKRRFPVLSLGIRLKTEKVQTIVVACAALHNVACMMNDTVPIDVNEDVERDIAGAINDVGYGTYNIKNATVRQALIQDHFKNLL